MEVELCFLELMLFRLGNINCGPNRIMDVVNIGYKITGRGEKLLKTIYPSAMPAILITPSN